MWMSSLPATLRIGLHPLISVDVKSTTNIKNGIRPFDEYEMWMPSLLETWRMGFTPFD